MPGDPNPDHLPPIHIVRGQRVVLDHDLARLYGVTTMVFNQAIRRNLNRFPTDFVFEISHPEYAGLISQSVISKAKTKDAGSRPVAAPGRGGRRKPALVFTPGGRMERLAQRIATW